MLNTKYIFLEINKYSILKNSKKKNFVKRYLKHFEIFLGFFLKI